MLRKRSQPSFADTCLAELGSTRTREFLARIDRFVDWAELAKRVRDIFGNDPLKPGQPHDSPVLVVKTLMLARWYNLSDPGLEEHCNDSIAVRQWLELYDDERSPDATTFCNWRKRLREAGHEHTIFDAVTRMLEDNKLIVDKGTIVDATVLIAPRPKKVKDEATGEMVKHFSDPEASYTIQGHILHGYRGYVATDVGGLVREVAFDTASVHESNHFDELTKKETKARYSDSAFFSNERVEKLKKKGIRDGIMRKPMRDQPLTKQQKLHNRRIRPIRAVVEHVFAWMKACTGYRRVHYKGIDRNRFDWRLRAAAFNLMRGARLAET